MSAVARAYARADPQRKRALRALAAGAVMRRLVALLAVGVTALGGAVAIAQGNGRAAALVGVHLTTLSHATFGSSVRADGAGVDFRTRGPKQALVTSITVDPGGTFGWHSHPGPVLVTVAKGTLAEFHAEGSRRWLAAVRSGLFSTDR